MPSTVVQSLPGVVSPVRSLNVRWSLVFLFSDLCLSCTPAVVVLKQIYRFFDIPSTNSSI